jgi:uncharacterized protein YaaN involved in tellurite resistance
MTKHSPSYYSSKLDTLNRDFLIHLNEMAESFPYAKAYPNIQSYTKRYELDKGAMDKTRSDIFILKDNIEQDIKRVDTTTNETIMQITKLEKDNAILALKLQELENKREGAIGLYDDSKELYNLKLLENWLMVLFISGIGYGIYKQR